MHISSYLIICFHWHMARHQLCIIIIIIIIIIGSLWPCSTILSSSCLISSLLFQFFEPFIFFFNIFIFCACSYCFQNCSREISGRVVGEGNCGERSDGRRLWGSKWRPTMPRRQPKPRPIRTCRSSRIYFRVSRPRMMTSKVIFTSTWHL